MNRQEADQLMYPCSLLPIQRRWFSQPKNTDIFSCISMKTCCVYSVKMLLQGSSNECPQNMLFISPRKQILWVLIRSASVKHFL